MKAWILAVLVLSSGCSRDTRQAGGASTTSWRKVYAEARAKNTAPGVTPTADAKATEAGARVMMLQDIRGNCQRQEGRANFWTGVGVAFGFLAGSSGLSTIAVKSDEAKYSLAGAGLGAGMFAALGGALAKTYTDAMEKRQCSGVYMGLAQEAGVSPPSK